MSIKLFLFAIVVLVDPGSRGSPFDDKTSKFSHRYEFDMMASSTRDDVSLQLFPQYNLILINRSSQLYIKEPLLLPPYIPLYLRDFKEIVYNVYCNNKVVDWSFTTVKDFHLLHAMEQSIVGNITVVVTAIKYVQNSLALQIFSAINVETKEREYWAISNLYPDRENGLFPGLKHIVATDISLNITIPPGYQTIISYDVSDSGQVLLRNYRFCDVAFVVMKTYYTYKYGAFQVLFKTGRNDIFPAGMHPLVTTVTQVYDDLFTFVFKNLSDPRLTLVVIQGTHYRPLVLSRGLCIMEWSTAVYEMHLHREYFAQCVLHQHFLIRMPPYRRSLYFFFDGYRDFYARLYSWKNADKITIARFVQEIIAREDDSETATSVAGGTWNSQRSQKMSAIFLMLRSNMKDPEVEWDQFTNTMEYTNDFSITGIMKAMTHVCASVGLDSTYMTEFLAEWFSRTGYPVITAEWSVDDNKVFLKSRTANGMQYHFWVPVDVTIYSETEDVNDEIPYSVDWVRVWLRTFRVKTPINVPVATICYFINGNATNLMRAKYDSRNWERLIRNYTILPESVKTTLFNDAYYFFSRDQFPFLTLLNLTQRLANETSSSVWRSSEASILEMDRVFRYTDFYLHFQLEWRAIIKNFYASRYPPDPVATKLACLMHYDECLRYARAKTIRFIGHGERYEEGVDLLCAGIRSVSDTYFRYLISIANMEYRYRYLVLLGMTCYENVDGLYFFLEQIFLDPILIPIRLQYLILVHMMRASTSGTSAIVEFLLHHRILLFRIFQRSEMTNLARMLAKYLKKRSHYRQMKFIGTTMKLQTIRLLSIIEAEIIFIKRNYRFFQRAWVLTKTSNYG